jgi:predicted O-linked N-acetylglucosamine transferase (SPINDLY family)
MPQITIEQAFDLALRQHRAGRLREAENLYRQILAQRPAHVDALHFLGVIAHQMGRNDIAVDLIRRAIALRPSYAEAHSNLGKVLRDKGQLDQAIAEFRQAIALNPKLPEALSNLGDSLRGKGQLDEAIAAYRQAVALRGGDAEAHNSLGNALKEGGELDQAIASYRQAVAVRSDYAEGHNNLGAALEVMGQLDEAKAAFRRAIALDPKLAEAHSNLGSVLLAEGKLDEAIAAYRQALRLRPDYAEAHGNLGIALAAKGQHDDALAAYRQAIALRPGYAEAHGNLLYTLHFHPGYDARSIAEEHRRWNIQHAEPLRKFVRPHANNRDPQRRLRIGYVSPNFREHPVGRFLLPLLSHHDKKHVEVFAYSQVALQDAITERLRSCADGWRTILGLSDAQVAELIRQDQIDVLVDLTMHMAKSRLGVFARKPAPVQVTYLAYCSTTGLQTIDYRLSDPYLDPPDGDDSVYSEQTIRLPETYWCYEPIVDRPEVGPLPALGNGLVTFGCLNNFAKVSEPALETWAQILKAVPNSRLLLSAHPGNHRTRLEERLEQYGIERSRVEFVGFMLPENYFELYQRIDIALDTFPYGGGTTTCDALWMGVPVISLVGATAVGRGGLSILSNIGLPELATRSKEDYVRAAGELANDLPRLGDLRTTLRQRMEQSPLMDAPKFAHNVEAAYRQMWRTWCEKLT